MTREEARKAAKVMLAYADGKELGWGGEYLNGTPTFNWDNDADSYRIKPESKYRPFNNAEECWEEMKKHEPFGWLTVLGKNLDEKEFIVRVTETTIKIYATSYYGYKEALSRFKFADGTPFGKQVID